MNLYEFELYPTPHEVVCKILDRLDIFGKNILEPHAGTGNFLKEINTRGGIVSYCEKQTDLAKLHKDEADFLSNDFFDLKPEDVSHMDIMVGNPPFSNQDEHLKHAWEIAPQGCQIVFVVNSTISYSRRKYSKEVYQLSEDYGYLEELGQVFKGSERDTDVDTAIIHLFKPRTGENRFDEFFDSTRTHQEGLMPVNEITNAVSAYVRACKCYDQVLELGEQMNEILPKSMGKKLTLKVSNEDKSFTRRTFEVALQKEFWADIFNKMNMGKYVTQKLKEQINEFVQRQSNYPFTIDNVYKVLDMVINTHGNRMESVLIEVFDRVTKHYSENRYQVEGWKTNSHYLVNQKIILPGVFEQPWGGGSLIQPAIGWQNTNLINDLVKAMDYVEGTSYLTEFGEFNSWEKKLDNGETIHGLFQNIFPNEWIDYGHFEIKGFKKGTAHIKFKDRDVWSRFNQRIGKIKGYPLPEKL